MRTRYFFAAFILCYFTGTFVAFAEEMSAPVRSTQLNPATIQEITDVIATIVKVPAYNDYFDDDQFVLLEPPDQNLPPFVHRISRVYKIILKKHQGTEFQTILANAHVTDVSTWLVAADKIYCGIISRSSPDIFSTSTQGLGQLSKQVKTSKIMTQDEISTATAGINRANDELAACEQEGDSVKSLLQK